MILSPSNKLKLFFSIILLFGFWILMPAYPGSGQAQKWSAPTLMSGNGQFSWFPDIAVDRTGKVHLVWSSGVGQFDVVMYMFKEDRKPWSQMNDIIAIRETAGGEATRPDLLVDTDGLAHLTYRYTKVFYSATRIEDVDNAATWSPPITMSDPAQVAYYSDLALDNQGGLHLVVTWNLPALGCPNCYHVFYRSSPDHGKTWLDPVDISGPGTGSAKPEILIDGKGNLYVTWESGIGGAYGGVTSPVQVKFSASYDGGKTWSQPTTFSSPSQEALNISLGIGDRDQLVAVWQGIPDASLYYQTSDDFGRSWSKTETIPGVWGVWGVYNSHLDRYSMATDSLKTVHLVFAGRQAEDQKTIDLLHATWDHNTWSKPEVITSYSGDVPEWPRIAIGGGNQLHAAWFVRDEAHVWESDKGLYKVWYSYSITDSPSVPYEAYPTGPAINTAVVKPTPTIERTSVPTVVSTISPGSASPVNSPNESNYLVLLGTVLIPSAALILGTLLFKGLKHR